MLKLIFADAPRDYQLFFQDTATPMMSGIIDLHQHIFFFDIIILMFVASQTVNIITFFKICTFRHNLRSYIKVVPKV